MARSARPGSACLKRLVGKPRTIESRTFTIASSGESRSWIPFCPDSSLPSTVRCSPVKVASPLTGVTGVAAQYSADRHLGLLADLVAGKLIAPIGHLYPLDDATQALADFAAPKLGKLVILTS